MKRTNLLAIVALLGFAAPIAIAQDAPERDERKTEAKPAEKTDEKAGEDDSPDANKAEKLLKRAYTRVHSAEAAGLKKLSATADIEVDASAFGFNKMQFPGQLWWKTGTRATWQSTAEEGDNRNPLSRVSDIARQLFEPYLAYVAGFEAWDVRFKDAKFELLEAKEDKENGKVEQIRVTYKDKRIEQFSVGKNTVLSFTKDDKIGRGDQVQDVKVTFTFEYEDLGKQLRPKKVTGSSEIQMPEMPGDNDPENPGKPKMGGSKDILTGSIAVDKWGKAGEYDVAVELKGSVSLKSLGVEFPATLKLTEMKVNDAVKDADFPKPEGDEDGEKTPPKKEDEEF
jgi:hypothetical protein